MIEDPTPPPMAPTPPSRPLPQGCGCLGLGALLWLDLFVLVGISTTVVQQLTPALADHGYNVRTGAGVLIALLLALIVAIYPVLWIHRTGSWAIRRWVR